MIERLKKDFEELKEGCMGILLFGSYAEEEPTKYNRLDLDAVQEGLNKVDVLYEVLDKLVEVAEREVFLEGS